MLWRSSNFKLLRDAKSVIYTEISAMGSRGHLRVEHLLSDQNRGLGNADVMSVGLLD